MTTILQAPLLIDFIYPFLLIFFIVFAILEKSKLFGDEKKQLNALVALVIGLIFISIILVLRNNKLII
jgi:multisubunit Na+/H+ antiporter MnhB subunit